LYLEVIYNGGLVEKKLYRRCHSKGRLLLFSPQVCSNNKQQNLSMDELIHREKVSLFILFFYFLLAHQMRGY